MNCSRWWSIFGSPRNCKTEATVSSSSVHHGVQSSQRAETDPYSHQRGRHTSSNLYLALTKIWSWVPEVGLIWRKTGWLTDGHNIILTLTMTLVRRRSELEVSRSWAEFLTTVYIFYVMTWRWSHRSKAPAVYVIKQNINISFINLINVVLTTTLALLLESHY
jgi:hypothetical protein